MIRLILLYLFIINALSFLLMLADKQMAKKKLRRIPEATLLTAAALGGSIGSLIGMYIIRHKTKHLKFVIGVPLILIAQITLVLWLFL